MSKHSEQYEPYNVHTVYASRMADGGRENRKTGGKGKGKKRVISSGVLRHGCCFFLNVVSRVPHYSMLSLE